MSTPTKVRLATVWLDGCSGCHMSFLDLDEALAELAAKIDLVYGPLVDAPTFPAQVDVTLVEGAVSSQDDLKLLRTIRARTKLLVALGDCAVTGNVPTMRNGIPAAKLLVSVYDGKAPKEVVPALLPKAGPLHESVPVDFYIPGCPPRPGWLKTVLLDLLAGRKPSLAGVAQFG
jgi:NAD-reducing hydrogenase small subunit